jgi:hypothetical protein
MRDIARAEMDGAGTRPQHTADQVDEGGFASAVGTNKRMTRTSGERQAHATRNMQSAEALVDTIETRASTLWSYI